ncbi:MAG TPA: TetR/AcrR family transcriptional regulator [Dyella sp.]|uniref:TetR/AcrR family transcriptional regulator n=1 Tax=Dyella sp. TaxID=1869338 RepID=UPI002C6C7AA3|nr:TetR/AcrR family transcriptional regulator [Dyella sp.]HTV85847.1 TetR/AcrR family transcriptional regulator [Dyella sp.]
MQIGTKKDPATKRPRGRPRAYDPDTALRRAAQAFWKSGYAGTSLDDISAATGMNRPSLSAAFGDKHAIYVKALSSYWDFKFAAMRKAFEGGGKLTDTLMKVYDAALSIYFADDQQALGCFVVSTAITEAPGDAQIREIVAKGFDALDADFEALFRRARDNGELNAGADPTVLAQLAVATMHSIAVRARSGSSRSALRKLAQNTTAALCK